MAGHSAIRKFDLETYETLVAYNGDILFEWDLVTDRFGATPNYFDIFGYLPSGEAFSKTIEKSENIHPDDKHVIKKYFETIHYNVHDLKNKKYYSRLELRIRNAYNEFTWCKIQLVAHYSSQNLPYKITGMITSIDFDKNHPQPLPQQEQNDPLTGLYHKNAATRLIEGCLQKADTGTCALLLIGIDEIRLIDSHFGSSFGDAVISDLAASIKRYFLESDIVGRFSGDKFIVFTANIQAAGVLKERLAALAALLGHAYRSGEQDYKIFARIGAALYPAHGKTIDALLSSAQTALHHLKDRGESGHAFYRNNMLKPARRQAPKFEDRLPKEKKSFYENLPEYIIKILYSAEDNAAAIQMLLEVIGRKFNVSRAFICTHHAANSQYRKTTAWCSRETVLLDSTEQEVPADLVELLFRSPDHRSLHVCSDLNLLTAPQVAYFKSIHTQSFLYGRIAEGETAKGYIGFDECRRERVWTNAEIDIIDFLSDVLSTFLLKNQTVRKPEPADCASSTVKLLHAIDNPLYIVDRYTHDILFVNNTLNSRLGAEEASGDKCYQLLYQLGRPCKDCPMQKLAPACRRLANEFYDKKRRRWLKRTASKIEWNDAPDCCLIQLHDITAQKDLEFLPMN